MGGLPQVKYTGEIREIKLGKAGSEVVVGGETSYNFYTFEGKMPNPPKLALQVLDVEPEQAMTRGTYLSVGPERAPRPILCSPSTCHVHVLPRRTGEPHASSPHHPFTVIASVSEAISSAQVLGANEIASLTLAMTLMDSLLRGPREARGTLVLSSATGLPGSPPVRARR